MVTIMHTGVHIYEHNIITCHAYEYAYYDHNTNSIMRIRMHLVMHTVMTFFIMHIIMILLIMLTKMHIVMILILFIIVVVFSDASFCAALVCSLNPAGSVLGK